MKEVADLASWDSVRHPEQVVRSKSDGDNTAVEMAAMRVAMDYERGQGRAPVDVSKTGVGYGVRSEDPDA